MKRKSASTEHHTQLCEEEEQFSSEKSKGDEQLTPKRELKQHYSQLRKDEEQFSSEGNGQQTSETGKRKRKWTKKASTEHRTQLSEEEEQDSSEETMRDRHERKRLKDELKAKVEHKKVLKRSGFSQSQETSNAMEENSDSEKVAMKRTNYVKQRSPIREGDSESFAESNEEEMISGTLVQKKGLHKTEVLRKERKGVKGTKEHYSSDSDDHSSEQTETESKENDNSESEEDSVVESPKSKGKTIQNPERKHSEIKKICKGSKPESGSKFAGQKRKRFQHYKKRVKLPRTNTKRERRPTQSGARGIGSHQSSTVEHGSDESSMEQDTPVMTYKRAREASDANAPTSFPNLQVSRKKSWKRKRRRRERLESTSSSSDTDDSSPESDMMRNISESETKKLRKVFRCFFGKLCREIRDPVEMAAELQSKRLLSQSTMEEILTTLDSRQEKVIILVRSLQRRIKSRPDRIFGIVKFFLRIEAIGKEMWLETGK